jgi:NIPSNAP
MSAGGYNDPSSRRVFMERRQFLAASIATSAVAMTSRANAQQEPAAPREFYQIRRYSLVSGPQQKLTENFFGNALIPALAKRGFGPIGAFQIVIGPETPTYYLIIPGKEVSSLATLDLELAEDQQFLDAAAPYWNATSTAPAFQRVEVSLLEAFAGWPKLTPPPSAATKAKRIFLLRTYESPSNGEHVRKVEMFHAGEFEIFVRAGFHPVFFGDTLAGSRMPNLTYMLALTDVAELDAKWDAFRNDPDWKKLQSNPRYAYDQIVSSISYLVLSPLECSQI